jgi:DNA-binding NtrC family response regulator
MAEGNKITAADLELSSSPGDPVLVTLEEAREAVDRKMVAEALERHSNKVAVAAAELGVNRQALYDLMNKLGVSREKECANGRT